jgi:serine/threonine-protein kinase
VPEDSLVIGPYSVVKEIERGGMGIIYKAKDSRTGAVVALKILKTGRNAPIEQVLRFHREASTIAKLSHPYIVSILNTGFSGDDYFIAMEFIDGKSLDEMVYEDKLSTRDVVDIVIKSLEAIEFAHSMNIIHRDLKPPNILVDRSLDPHIIDFGLATFVKGHVRLTRTGIVMGTIGYIAPERIRGIEVDERVDIFSMGAILYESLTKKIPYETDSRVISVPTNADELIPIRKYMGDVPPNLDSVCAKALAVDPAGRYGSAWEFRLALEEIRSKM